jgi:hypothetical protein
MWKSFSLKQIVHYPKAVVLGSGISKVCEKLRRQFERVGSKSDKRLVYPLQIIQNRESKVPSNKERSVQQIPENQSR